MSNTFNPRIVTGQLESQNDPQNIIGTDATGTPQTNPNYGKPIYGTNYNPANPVPAANPVAPVSGGTTVTPAPTAPASTSNMNPTNAMDVASQIVANPSSVVNGQNGTSLAETSVVKNGIDENAAGTNINPNDPKYAQATGPLATTATVGNVAQGTVPAPANGGVAQGYEVDKTETKVTDPKNQMQAAQGTVNPNAVIDASKIQLDTQAIATGKNPDGSVNAAGAALNQAAQQNIVNVIDTSTMAGKILAEQLGEGNYTDSKATLKGQLDILSAEFANPDGSAKIPIWAQGTARGVSKIAAFTGMTGTAATAAMATAIMEASIPVAQADATFFQTVTLKNLDNRQEQTINKANVLSKLELANMDARMAAAVENSKNFMQMDLANLDNEQQARAINTQARFQSILEDSKAVNSERLFVANSQNEKDMFYDNLNASMSQFNATQKNGMAQFNAGELNSTSKFNAELENSRQEFYKNMQFNIDTANAKWRQTVTLTENQQQFEAAQTDVANKLGISKEAMNQIWDRSDALLDYVWKSSESELERKNNLLMAANQQNAAAAMNSANNKAANTQSIFSGIGSVAGTVLGAAAGSAGGIKSLFDWF